MRLHFALFASFLVAGCVRLDPDHCANQGDPRGYCDERHGVAYCSACESESNGCREARPSDLCDPVGGVAETGTTSSSGMTTDVTMSASMSSTTVDPTSSTEVTTTMSTTESMDTSTGELPPGCGNNMVEETLDENCDGTDMPAETCSEVALAGGTLGCYEPGHPLECTYDLSNCDGASQCDNGVIEGTEQCDMDQLADQTCETVNESFIGGELSCNPTGSADPCTFNTSACEPCIAGGLACETNAQCCSQICGALTDTCNLL